MSRFWSPFVHNLTPYTPGEQPIHRAQQIKLNTNENPFPPSNTVINALAQACNANLRKYPDPNGTELKHTISRYYQLKPEHVFLGNSSDEVLAHIFKTFFAHSLEKKPLLFADISYSFYPVWCQFFDIPFKTIALKEDFTIDAKDYMIDNRGIIITNPNAPTGIALTAEKIEQIIQQNLNSVVVIDEAYVDFSEHSARCLIEKYDNLIIVQTLSKSRSLAGLRVGFALAHPDLIEGLERIKNSFHPFPLDQIALKGAVAAFEDTAYFEQCRQQIIQTRENSSEQLKQLGFEVLPSQTNFLFAKPDKISAQTLFNQLRLKNIYIRYFNQTRIHDFVRISIGTEEEMQALFTAIKEIIKTAKN